jgi:hypothetical protein
MKQKHSTKTSMCPQEHLVIRSYTTSLSFALERIGPLAAITTIVFYLLVLYLLALPNTPENPFANIYSEYLIKTACQHLLLLIGFDTLIYRKYYDTPPILVGHQVRRQLTHLYIIFFDTLYIHVSLSFSLLFLFLFLLSKTQKDQKYFYCFSLFASLVF